MSKTETFPSTYLNLWEAINLLAYGIASETGGSEWREAKLADGHRAQSGIKQEEMARFVWAVKILGQLGEREKIHVLGHRKHHTELLPIPARDFINAGFDLVSGFLNPTKFTVDYDRRVWMGLQFKRDEIEAMRSVCRFVDPEAPLSVTAAQKYENWADRAEALRKQGSKWREAAETIAKSDGGADPLYVERQVRRVRSARKRESGKTI